MRVIDDDGEQLGIMAPQQALVIAKQKDLDLVEISPTASPPPTAAPSNAPSPSSSETYN